MEVISKQTSGPIVHLLRTNYGSSRPRLVQGHKLVKDRPMLLLARTGQVVVGRSALPQVRTTLRLLLFPCIVWRNLYPSNLLSE